MHTPALLEGVVALGDARPHIGQHWGVHRQAASISPLCQEGIQPALDDVDTLTRACHVRTYTACTPTLDHSSTPPWSNHPGSPALVHGSTPSWNTRPGSPALDHGSTSPLNCITSTSVIEDVLRSYHHRNNKRNKQLLQHALVGYCSVNTLEKSWHMTIIAAGTNSLFPGAPGTAIRCVAHVATKHTISGR